MTAIQTQQSSLFDPTDLDSTEVDSTEPDSTEADPVAIDLTEAEVPAPSFNVNVIRSAKRKKSSEAHLVGTRLDIRIPNAMTAAEETEVVDYFVEKFEKRYGAERINLEERAQKLARTYGLESPNTIRWVSNQTQRWGSCSFEERTIRLSDKLAPFPDWVIDYVIVHELAHLTVPAHNDEFWEIVNRYPKTERARGYLIAMAHAET